MQNVKISQNARNLLYNSRLGVILSNVKVEPSSQAFKANVANIHAEIIEKLESKNEKEFEIIAETRKAYKVCGKEPSRYRPSSEALLRRLRTKRALYEINNVVDSVNLISIYSHYSIGGFDTTNISGEVILDVGDASEYHAIGRGKLNIEFMPGVKDALGFFGTPTSDSMRTMVNENTKELLLVFYDFYGNDKLESALDFADNILREYCYATDIERCIIE